MTPWLRLNLICFGLALPIVGILFAFLRSERAMALDRWSEPVIASKWFFRFGMGVVAVLYVFSIRTGGSYDELNYMTELRDHGLFHGHNHFLSHFFAWLVYGVVHHFTQDTLLMMKMLNCTFGIALFWLVRNTIEYVTENRALGNLGGILLGVSFGVWKYAVSAEVYTIELFFWVACLVPAIRIHGGDDSWKQFFILSALSNLTVLAHDLASVMSVAFLALFLIFGGKKRIEYTKRYVVSGLLLFFCFQVISSFMTGITDVRGYLNHHLYYYFNPDGEPGDYQFTVFKNLFILAREGLFSMFTGIDSQWMDFGLQAAFFTILVHLGVAAPLLYFYTLAIGHLRGLWKNDRRLFFAVALAAGNWLSIYSFFIFYRPCDEFHQWFLPFTVLGLCFFLGYMKTVPRPVLSVFIFLVASVAVASSGIYNRKAGNKMLTSPKSVEMLRGIDDNENIVFVDDETTRMGMHYFRPQVVVSGDLDVLEAAVRKKKMVFLRGDQPSYRDFFLKKGFKIVPWYNNPHYSRVLSAER